MAKEILQQLERYHCICDKCGFKWLSKSLVLPKVCGKCKSFKWNENEEILNREEEEAKGENGG